MDYTFQFSSTGQIVGYRAWRADGRSERERIDRDEKAYVDGRFIVIEERDEGDLEWDLFHDPDNDGLWQKLASGEGSEILAAAKLGLAAPLAQPLGFRLVSGPEDTLFRFNASGAVTHVGELERNGKVDFDKVDRDEVYQLQGEFVLEQEFGKRGPEEWTLYRDADQDGFWAEVATGRGQVDLVGLIATVSSLDLGGA